MRTNIEFATAHHRPTVFIIDFFDYLFRFYPEKRPAMDFGSPIGRNGYLC
jgi:hypothetical protein